MVISDSLMDEVLQILVALPFRTVSPTIGRIQAELAVQQQANKPTIPTSWRDPLVKPSVVNPDMTAAESVESARAQFHREADALNRKMGIG